MQHETAEPNRTDTYTYDTGQCVKVSKFMGISNTWNERQKAEINPLELNRIKYISTIKCKDAQST